MNLLVAFLAGAIVAYLLARTLGQRALAEAHARVAAGLAAAQEGQQRIVEMRKEAGERQALIEALIAEKARLEQDKHWQAEDLQRQHAALGNTQALLERADQKLRDAFQSLAAEALHTNRAAFLDLARASFDGFQKEAVLQVDARQKAIDCLIRPIGEALRNVDERLAHAEQERLATYSRLTEQLAALGSSTHTLARALRTPAVRGRWGEMQLRRVVEIAGMLHRCDFDEQPGVATENGRLRPDVIVHLPGGTRIVVDAKAPLEAFLDAQECTDEEARHVKLQAHARQVREHMESLGGKAYWEQLGQSPEMVVMFLPGETLFSAALQHDLTLIEHGLQHRVLLASPITLIALLTTIAHSWRTEALTENYREVAQLGKEFYERLAKFTDHFDEMRRKLDGAVQAYNQAAGSFESRILVSARKLRDLKVTTASELPPAEPIDTVPRVLKQIGLMGLPEGATTESEAESTAEA